jgi:hypothetical protein
MEPDASKHHIFTDFQTAQNFYDAIMQDISIPIEVRERLKTPRQSHGGVWIVDRVVL